MDLTNPDEKAPTVILINQYRKIGVMYGNPNTLPGGRGQNIVRV